MLRLRTFASLALGLTLLSTAPLSAQNSKKKDKADKAQPVPAAQLTHPVLWEERKDIPSEDLLLGLGGEEHKPKPPFTFASEATGGTNPKFDIHDADDKKWRVKLGSEARPEVTASRFLWAMGYFTDEDYNLATATVSGLKLKRGAELVHGEDITEARFARKPGGQNKIGIWKWKGNPFLKSREFNGLRVMMALMNNWDLKDVNNAIYQDKKHDRQLYLVSDIGATFASNDEHVRHDTDKGNLESYEKSKFIIDRNAKSVSFGTPMAPAGLLLRQGPVLFGEYVRRFPLSWIGHDVPLQDVRWMAGQLGQLSHKQIEDAFRAGNFPDDQREAFVKIVETRIAELKQL